MPLSYDRHGDWLKAWSHGAIEINWSTISTSEELEVDYAASNMNVAAKKLEKVLRDDALNTCSIWTQVSTLIIISPMAFWVEFHHFYPHFIQLDNFLICFWHIAKVEYDFLCDS